MTSTNGLLSKLAHASSKDSHQRNHSEMGPGLVIMVKVCLSSYYNSAKVIYFHFISSY